MACIFGITIHYSLDFTTEQIILGSPPQLIIDFQVDTIHMCLTNPLIAHICHHWIIFEIRLCHLCYLKISFVNVDSKCGAVIGGGGYF